VVTFAETSEVLLGPFPATELDQYLASGAWQGKAGAYGIQDEPSLVRAHRGSFSNVVGLPLEALRKALAGL
jgi:septum formation protein